MEREFQDKRAIQSVKNAAATLKSINDKLEVLCNAHFGLDLEELMNVDDLRILTEDYAESECETYFENNKDFIERLSKNSTEQNKEILIRAPPVNELLLKAQANIDSIPKASFLPLLASSRSSIKSKVHYLQSKHADNLRVATDYIVVPESANMLSAKLQPQLKYNPSKPTSVYFKVSFYSSITDTKLNEFIVSQHCLVSDLFDAVDCLVCKMEPKKYNRFLCLKSSIVCETSLQKGDLNTKFIFERMKAAIPEATFVPVTPTLTVGDLDIDIDFVGVFRDNLECDHMAVFSDALALSFENSDSLNGPLIQIFVPKYFVRTCEVCNERNAAKIVTNSRVSHKTVSFFCKTCFEDLLFDEKGIAKVTDFQAVDYVYEER